MSEAVTIALITGGFGLLVAIATGVFSIIEKRKSTNDRTEIKNLKQRVDDLEQANKSKDGLIQDQAGIIEHLREWGAELQQALYDVRDWAGRMCSQLTAAGIEPEPFIQHGERKTEPRHAEVKKKAK